jgi:ATP-dependent DNA ligase
MARRRRTHAAALPGSVRPQLTHLIDAAPEGDQWLHEIKYDGYRMHARLDRGAVKLLTRTGLDWTHKYPAIAKAERKDRLAALLANAPSPLHYSDHQLGHGRAFFEKACAISLEGIVSKHADAACAPGNRGLWLKVKCLHREEFVVVGWTDPEVRAGVGAPSALHHGLHLSRGHGEAIYRFNNGMLPQSLLFSRTTPGHGGSYNQRSPA